MNKKSETGGRSEQQFFEDPAVDGVMGVLMALATEHYVLRDRVRVLEKQLTKSGHLDAAALAAAPVNEDAVEATDEANAFVQELLRPLLGLQDSLGTGGRFSLKTSKRRRRT